MDGFQARCLRNVVGAKAADYSRISNEEVRRRAGQSPYSRQLLKHQLHCLARWPGRQTRIRKLTFQHHSLEATTAKYLRKRGRPRNEWAVKLQDAALRMAAPPPSTHTPATESIDRLQTPVGARRQHAHLRQGCAVNARGAYGNCICICILLLRRRC